MNISHKEIFLNHVAQTSHAPLGLEIANAEGIYIYDTSGKKYFDFISGIAVSSVGHLHPKVKEAVVEQMNKYAHIMVYGETIQQPQTEYAQLITKHLPEKLNCIYFVNSGAEATEGAMKLAKAYTQQHEIIAFENGYHGSTQGALSIAGNEWLKAKFRPLIPGIKILKWQDANELHKITHQTAAVFIEPVRGEAGVQIPDAEYLHKIRQRCNETGTLLVFDEIQTGFGRTGKLFAFEHFNLVPDILLLGKAMGGGLPVGAFIADKKIMDVFASHPLGHLTTFGGNAVCVAAALAVLKIVLQEKLSDKALYIEKVFKEKLKHKNIIDIRIKGAMAAIQLESNEQVMEVIDKCLNKGLILDWFLFAPDCIRLAPPLIIKEDELNKGIEILLESLNDE